MPVDDLAAIGVRNVAIVRMALSGVLVLTLGAAMSGALISIAIVH